jgi:hypothetical protein
MPSAPNGHPEAGAPRELHRGHHVRDATAARDQRREAIDGSVPDPAVPVVGRVAGPDEVPLERRAQLAQRRPIDLDVGSDRAHHSSFGPRPYAGDRPQHCRSAKVVPHRPGS